MWEGFLLNIHGFDVMRGFIPERNQGNLLNVERPLSKCPLRIHQRIHNGKKLYKRNAYLKFLQDFSQQNPHQSIHMRNN